MSGRKCSSGIAIVRLVEVMREFTTEANWIGQKPTKEQIFKLSAMWRTLYARSGRNISFKKKQVEAALDQIIHTNEITDQWPTQVDIEHRGTWTTEMARRVRAQARVIMQEQCKRPNALWLQALLFNKEKGLLVVKGAAEEKEDGPGSNLGRSREEGLGGEASEEEEGVFVRCDGEHGRTGVTLELGPTTDARTEFVVGYDPETRRAYREKLGKSNAKREWATEWVVPPLSEPHSAMVAKFADGVESRIESLTVKDYEMAKCIDDSLPRGVLWFTQHVDGHRVDIVYKKDRDMVGLLAVRYDRRQVLQLKMSLFGDSMDSAMQGSKDLLIPIAVRFAKGLVSRAELESVRDKELENIGLGKKTQKVVMKRPSCNGEASSSAREVDTTVSKTSSSTTPKAMQQETAMDASEKRSRRDVVCTTLWDAPDPMSFFDHMDIDAFE